jgi:hypothetical protein
VYEFTHEYTEVKRNENGCLEFPGGTLWAYGYMTACFGRIGGDVFKEVDGKEVDGLDEDLIQNEVEGRFVWLFRQAWREEVR